MMKESTYSNPCLEFHYRNSVHITTGVTLSDLVFKVKGHKDDGFLDLSSEENESIVNEGIFRVLLKMRIRAGNIDLIEHFNTASAQTTYILKTTQNYIINCYGEKILSIIRDNIKDVKLYSILFNEIMAISQLSELVRYTHGSEIREDFIGFIDIYKFINGLQFDNEIKAKIDG
ncbi:unnamed protein product [Psylliodes chrysocephalus]|uniref:Uncharacterized protein n=1 Tax=Psylliodes chrysocephalus TaxID=3402493 RepID=A0A9P0GBC9_9CUCU|nr:unnamed protein product [Psylliodes chrysocephala]